MYDIAIHGILGLALPYEATFQIQLFETCGLERLPGRFVTLGLFKIHPQTPDSLRIMARVQVRKKRLLDHFSLHPAG